MPNHPTSRFTLVVRAFEIYCVNRSRVDTFYLDFQSRHWTVTVTHFNFLDALAYLGLGWRGPQQLKHQLAQNDTKDFWCWWIFWNLSFFKDKTPKVVVTFELALVTKSYFLKSARTKTMFFSGYGCCQYQRKTWPLMPSLQSSGRPPSQRKQIWSRASAGSSTWPYSPLQMMFSLFFRRFMRNILQQRMMQCKCS